LKGTNQSKDCRTIFEIGQQAIQNDKGEGGVVGGPKRSVY